MIRDFVVLPADAAVASAGAAGATGGAAAGDAPVRDAATVMLVRDGSAGIEVFVFRRVASMAFAAGMHVFPGGRSDPADADPSLPWAGPPPEAFARVLGATPAAARALVVTAIRETFEECGVLLAAAPGGGPVTGLRTGADAARQALLDQRTSLADLLLAAGLELRADLLTGWARWVTPAYEPRRYDTRFFVAAMPPEQDARDLGGEGEHAQWLTAADAVQRWQDGTARMLPPTVVTLTELAAAPDVAALRATPRSIRPVMPWRVVTADGRVAVRVDLDGRGGGEPAP